MGRRLGLLEGPGVSTERAMTDDGPACRSSPSNGRLGSGGVRQAREAPQPVAGRQGRESEPDAGPGVAARAGLGERGRGGGRPGGLHRPLQLGPAALPCGGLPPDVTDLRSKQRHGTQQLTPQSSDNEFTAVFPIGRRLFLFPNAQTEAET